MIYDFGKIRSATAMKGGRSAVAVIAFLLLAAAICGAQTSTIITVAGDARGTSPAPNGFSGDGGPATSAQLAEPYGAAIDAAGNIYIADTLNHRIRMVNTAGTISTIAGTGVAGFVDNVAATSARFNQPLSVAVDSAGNIYVADQSNNRIRRFTVGGNITTVAGSGVQGFGGDGGAATSAQLNHPASVAVDGSGNIYIADTGNSRIRKVTGSTISTFAGKGYFIPPSSGVSGYSGENVAATTARLNQPQGVSVDTAGNVYIADTLNNIVRKVTGGVISTIAGVPPTADIQVTYADARANGSYNGDNRPATSATLNLPYSAAAQPDGSVLIADYFNYRIRRVVIGGNITTVAGNGLSGYDGDGTAATSAYISDPVGVFPGATTGTFFIVDQSSNRIRKVFPYTPPATAPPSVTANPADAFTQPGGAATFTAAATGAPAPSVQWQVSTDGGFSFANVPGATGGIYSFTAALTDNGKMFRAVFTNSTGTAPTTAGRLYVRSAPRPVTDLDGDRIGDLTVWRPASGTWFTLTSTSGFNYANYVFHQWGNNSLGDKPMMGDLDGDGLADLVVWRPTDGTWYWLTSSSGYSPVSSRVRQWGNNSLGDQPMLADMDGDGLMDLVLWRASTGTWYWLTSSSGYSYAASGAKQWGSTAQGDIPKVGDIDGDGRADLIVWRAPSGTWFWLTSSSGYSYAASGAKQWGNQGNGDVPMIGDLDGDSRADLVVWRAPVGTWYSLTSSTGYSYAQSGAVQWGNQSLGDVPLLTDLDGDGRSDLVVWRAPSGTWYWLKSTAGYAYASQQGKQWGSQANNDIPIVR
jgi:hypothetical protein